MDGLAKAFSGNGVVFLEYDVNSTHAIFRADRFMAAWYLEKMPGEHEPETPYTMVDSGSGCSWGERDFRAEYRAMIDAELERPPLAEIHASRERPDPSTMIVKAQVTNLSTTTLQTGLNFATLHVKLYEGHRALQTGRIIHASITENFNDPLKPGDTRYFEYTFDKLKGVNMSLLDAVVMVDYQPDPITGRWDMMNAAIAETSPLPPTPTPFPTSTETPLPTKPPTPVPTDVPTLVPTQVPIHVEVYLPLALRRYSLIK